MNIKYAYLIFDLSHPFPSIEHPFYFDETTYIQTASLSNDFKSEQSIHWVGWLGTIVWDSLSHPQHIIKTWKTTVTPGIFDEDNLNLKSKVTEIFNSIKLVGPLKAPSRACILTGDGILKDGLLVASTIKEFTEMKTWISAFFFQNWDDDIINWTKGQVGGTHVLDVWKRCWNKLVNLLKNQTDYQQLVEAHRSFEEALSNSQLEFKIPNLVRALECIVDCWGNLQFAERVMYLLGHPDTSLPFEISENTDVLLQDLYQLRNDCSHGKIFAYSMEQKLHRMPSDREIGRYEFLSEWAVRKLLNDSLQNPIMLQISKNRATVESAWKNQLILPL